MPKDGRENLGKRTVLDDKRARARMLDAARSGAAMRHIAAAGGITRHTLNSWENRAARGEEPYASFIEELEQAKGEGVQELIESIREKIRDDWKAAAWLLQYCHGYAKAVSPQVVATISGQAASDLQARAERALAMVPGRNGEED